MEELSLNILDIAQNSVRANATRVDITVAELPAEDRLVITITDNGCGMTPNRSPMWRTRSTPPVPPARWGWASFFQNGRTDDRRGLFHLFAAGRRHRGPGRFGLTHIDRMPLGNMADTMCILMGCNEQINFSFTYRVGEKAFTVSTGAAAGDFGRRSPEYPQVMDFIRGTSKKIWICLAEVHHNMKSLAELQALRDSMKGKIGVRDDAEGISAWLWVWLPAESQPAHGRC